jgi:endonuclease/exonuclease/phosphatase family metal-dependent hydrolase
VGLAALIAALGLCLMPGTASAAKKKKPDRVRIVSYNLYLGSDLNRVINAALAGDPDGIADASGAVFRNVVANDFTLRARAIAKRLKKNKVDLVGLQEAALWRLEVPTDGGAPSILNPNATFALVPLIDYIDTLLEELNKKALSKRGCTRFEQKHPGKECYRGYKTVGLGVQTEADAEQPADLDGNDQTGVDIPPDDPIFHGIDADARLTMRDALIVRKGSGIKLRNTRSSTFSPNSTLAFEIAGGIQTFTFTRGWVSTDANVRGKRFRLVNTHLESESVGTFREDQASELVAPGGPATAPRTVLIGDLNSDPARPPTNLPDGDGGSNIAINRLFAAGFFPVQPPGLTGGHGELLSDLSNTLDNGRIDHILANSPSIRFRGGRILDPIGGGLWASDHGGVLSVLAIPGGKKKKK